MIKFCLKQEINFNLCFCYDQVQWVKSAEYKNKLELARQNKNILYTTGRICFETSVTEY